MLEALLEDSDEEAVEGITKKPARRNKDRHATYMRFWRTITENKAGKTPEQVLAQAKAAKGNSKVGRGMFTYWFEEWQQAGGDWLKSTIMVNFLKSKSERKIGTWVDMTEADLMEKYKEESVINLVRARCLCASQARRIVCSEPPFRVRDVSLENARSTCVETVGGQACTCVALLRISGCVAPR
jgi:hypothetical protein